MAGDVVALVVDTPIQNEPGDLREGMKIKTILLGMLSVLLIGADFYSPKVEGYRVWVGPNEQLDWIDLCCEWNEKLELVWADYSPIETLEIDRTKNGQVYIIATKKHSQWRLTGSFYEPDSWIGIRLKP